jgi:hypothetical protein
MFILNKIIKSKHLFWKLNKRYIGYDKKSPVIESIAVRSDTPLRHLIYAIEKTPQNQCCILLFHSILKQSDSEKMKDCWYYEYGKFETLCKYLANNKYNVKTLMEVVREYE